jgi:hypothetical protein
MVTLRGGKALQEGRVDAGSGGTGPAAAGMLPTGTRRAYHGAVAHATQ